MAFGELVLARSIQELQSWQTQEDTTKAIVQLDRRMRAQTSAAAEMVASVQALEDIERRNGCLLSDIGVGLGLVCDELDYGFRTLATEARLQSETLCSILKTLESPRTTQAREMKDKGMIARRNGWLEDAERELIGAADLDPYDFIVQQAVGDVIWDRRQDLEAALERYEKAARYAEPVSKLDAALSLLSAARISKISGDVDLWRKFAERAVTAMPSMPETHYCLGKSCLSSGSEARGAAELVETLKLRRGMSGVMVVDRDLVPYATTVESALREYRDWLAPQVEASLREPVEVLRGMVALSTTMRELETRTYEDKNARSRFMSSVHRRPAVSSWSALSEMHELGRHAASLEQRAVSLLEVGSIADLDSGLILGDTEYPALAAAISAALIRQLEDVDMPPDAQGQAAALWQRLNPDAPALVEYNCPYCDTKVNSLSSRCARCGEPLHFGT